VIAWQFPIPFPGCMTFSAESSRRWSVRLDLVGGRLELTGHLDHRTGLRTIGIAYRRAVGTAGG
jgi:hypothetical protein